MGINRTCLYKVPASDNMADHHPGLEVDTRPHDKRYSDLEVVPDSNQTHAHGDHTTLSQNEKKSGLNSTSQPLAYDGGLEAVHPNVGGDAGAAEHGGEPGAGKSEKKSKKGTSICGLKKQTVCIAVAILVGLFIVAIAVGVGLGVGLRSSSEYVCLIPNTMIDSSPLQPVLLIR